MRRESKGWTRTELARRAGLASDTHVRLIEEGRRADPQASTVVKLARALGCTPNDLLPILAGAGPWLDDGHWMYLAAQHPGKPDFVPSQAPIEAR